MRIKSFTQTKAKGQAAVTLTNQWLPSHLVGRPVMDGSAFDDRGAIEALEGNTIVFCSVDRLATTAANVPVRVYSGRRYDPADAELLDTHPLVDLLNMWPNMEQDSREFRYVLAAQMLVSKRGAIVEVHRDSKGTPLALELLDPRYTYPVPGKERTIDGWDVFFPGGGRKKKSIPAFDEHNLPRVLWFRRWIHPYNPLGGMTPLQPLALAIDEDKHAALFNRNFLANDGRPEGLLVLDANTTQQAINALMRRINGRKGQGYQSVRGLEIVGNASGGKLINLASNQRDAQYLGGRERNEGELMIGMATPKSILGDASNRTYANAEAEEAIYFRWVFSPFIEAQGRTFDRVDMDPSTFVDFDLSAYASADIESKRREEADLKMLRAGAITRNEFRTRRGLEEIDDPTADELPPLRTPSMLDRLGSDLAESARPAPALTIEDHKELASTSDNDEDLGAKGELPTVPVVSEQPPFEWGGVRLDGPEVVELARDRARKDAMRREAYVLSEIRSYVRKQKATVIAKLNSAKVNKIAEKRARAGETSKVSADQVFDEEAWNRILNSTVTEVVTRLVEEGGEEAAGSLGITFNLDDPKVQDFITSRVTVLVDPAAATGDPTKRNLNGRIVADIRQAIADGEAEGEGPRKIADRVRAVYEDKYEAFEAERIARTEVHSSVSGSRHLVMSESDAVDDHVWLAVPDDRTRQSHLDADGQRVPKDEPFTVDGEELRYPGDDGGSPENTINCRCRDVYVSADGSVHL